METSGNYRMILTYLVPDEPTSGEDFSEEVEFVFAYRHVEGQQQQQNTDDNDTATTNPIRRTINVTAINNMVMQGLDYVEKLNATIQTNATDTGNILRDVNATQRVLQNIQGNLTGVIPLAQGEVFLPTNITRSATT
jgi:hypothetical protein